MRKLIVPALLALSIAVPGAAFAASTTPMPASKSSAMTSADQTISDTVKSVDLKARTLTLADGKSYELPLNFKDPGLRAGEKVTVHWKQNGSMNQATSVSIG